MELMTQLRADQTRIEKALADYVAQWPSYGALKDAMSYSLLSGGKRIRPALTLAVCRLFGGREEDAPPLRLWAGNGAHLLPHSRRFALYG